MNRKKIAVYHGLGGGPNPEKINFLKSIGYNKIYYPLIDYYQEWDYDRCRILCNWELENAKDADVILGFSLGGYMAYILAGILGKDLILVNPSIDRSKTKLDIKSFDVIPKNNFKNIELFLGDRDTLIDNNIPINYLRENNIKADIITINGMEHNTPIEYFIEIINKSKLI